MKVIQYTGTIDISCTGDCNKTYSAVFRFPLPAGLEYGQVDGDTGSVEGLLVETGSIDIETNSLCTEETCHRVDVSLYNPTMVDASSTGIFTRLKFIFRKHSDSESSDSEESNDDSGSEDETTGEKKVYSIILNEDSSSSDVLNDLFETMSIEVDSHWDCYCKTQQVCGCGCDPLHDGW